MTKVKAELHTSQPIKPKSIAIVGGGVASTCLAHAIFKTQPQSQITLFCADSELANRGSSNKQGAIYPLLQAKHSILASLYADAYNYAKPFYQGLIKQGIEFEHNWCGVLQQAYEPDLVEKFKKISTLWPNDCELLTSAESSIVAGLELPYASLFYKNGGWLSPQQLCRNTLNYLAYNYDLDIQLNCTVKHLSKTENEKWLVCSEENVSTEFDSVIVCGGHLSNQIEQTRHLPVVPIRGQVSQLTAHSSASALNTVLCHSGYITPSQGQYQCFGATFERHNLSEISTIEDDIHNLNQLKTTYSDCNWAKLVSKEQIIANNAALRATSLDHAPIVGEVFSDEWLEYNVDKNNGLLKRKDKIKLNNTENGYQPNPNKGLYVFTGLGARGLTTAPLLANYLTCLLFGLESQLTPRQICSIAPIRFQVRKLKRTKSTPYILRTDNEK